MGLAHALLCHVASSFPAADVSQGTTEGETKTGKTQALWWPRFWLGDPELGQRKAEKERERRGERVEAPGAVGRSHTRSAGQQTQFTKRHLFHYSNALWLITSWPVCEMTATYSPVNRKICTRSIWGVGEQRRGGRGGREGGRPRGRGRDRRKPEKERELAGRSRPGARHAMRTTCGDSEFGAPRFKMKALVLAAVAFPSYSGTAGPRFGRLRLSIIVMTPGLGLGDKPTCPFAAVSRGL